MVRNTDERKISVGMRILKNENEKVCVNSSPRLVPLHPVQTTIYDYNSIMCTYITILVIPHNTYVIIKHLTNISVHFHVTDYELLGVKPSVIAAASIMSAMVGIRIKRDSDHLQRLCSLIKANLSDVENIATKIERIVSQEMSHLNKPVSKMVDSDSLTCYEPLTKYSDLDNEPKKPETPVDVQNVNF